MFTCDGIVIIINIYRPDYSEKNRFTVKDFLKDFTLLLESFAVNRCPIVIVGDFNLHVELLNHQLETLSSSKKVKHNDAVSFLKLLEDFDYSQQISKATQIQGGTLDLLIISKAFLDVVKCHDVGSRNEICSTDHMPIHFSLDRIPVIQSKSHVYMHRDMNNLSNPVVLESIKEVNLQHVVSNSNINDAVLQYNQILNKVTKKFFPSTLKSVKSRKSQKWFNSELTELKRTRRRSERKFKKYPTDEHYNEMENIRSFMRSSVKAAKTSFYKDHIGKHKGDLKKLYKTVNALVDEDEENILPSESNYSKLADDFVEFFQSKVSNIRAPFQTSNTASMQSSLVYSYTNNASMSSFNAISSNDLLKITEELNNKESTADPIPLPFLKENIDYFIPIILNIVNRSLTSGVLPDDIKHAVVSPKIKDRKLDNEINNNYRPVSSLPYLSKIIEKSCFISNKCVLESK